MPSIALIMPTGMYAHNHRIDMTIEVDEVQLMIFLNMVVVTYRANTVLYVHVRA